MLAAAPAGGEFRSLAAAIAAISIAGATFGLTVPLITLVMKSWGAPESLIGLNAAMPGVAALVLIPFFPNLIRRFGLLNVLYGCLALVVLTLLAFPLFPNPGAWFALRLVNGGADIGIFAATEIWVNQVAGESVRGRVIAVYTTILSIGFICGALLLSVVGVEGWLPFITGAVLIACASVPLLLAGDGVPDIGSPLALRFIAFVRAAPIIAGAAALAGLLYMAATALLPAYALERGFDNAAGARLVAYLAAGQLGVPLLVGLLADRLSRHLLIQAVAAFTAGLFWTLPQAFAHEWLRGVWVFMLGGGLISLYTLALTLLGQRFRGTMLAAATAAITVSFSIGEMGGPPLVGAAMDLNPNAYAYSMAALTTLFFSATLVPRLRGA